MHVHHMYLILYIYVSFSALKFLGDSFNRRLQVSLAMESLPKAIDWVEKKPRSDRHGHWDRNPFGSSKHSMAGLQPPTSMVIWCDISSWTRIVRKHYSSGNSALIDNIRQPIDAIGRQLASMYAGYTIEFPSFCAALQWPKKILPSWYGKWEVHRHHKCPVK
jgi:hypothetical protein